MRYKASQFNVWVNGPNFVAVYHTATGNYAVLTEDEQRLLRSASHAPITNAGRLASFGLLVNADVHEVEALATVFGRRFAGQPSAVSLTIAPTLDCNFGCAYCFETHEKGNMPVVTQDALLEFAGRLAASGGTPLSLAVTWFGGEPLMALGVIRRLTAGFRRLVNEGTISDYVVSSLITNGYGLTAKVSAELLELGVRKVQVTLDGPAEVHDRRRFLKRGAAPSWEAVVTNLQSVPSELEIAIRVNVDRANMGSVVALMAALENRGLFPRVSIHLNEVEDYTPNPATSDSMLTPQEFSAWWVETSAVARSRGWPLSSSPPRPSIRGVCQVDSLLAFVVHPNGTLYRCYAELGNKAHHPVGTLRDPRTWASLGWAPFQTRDPFDDPECRSCALLPTCMGGCPILRDINRRLRTKACPPYKYHFDRLIMNTYGTGERLVFDMTPVVAT